ncbi:MAG: hypothetical protein ACRDIE_25885, partial [Chloroflexota bacterium]
EQGDLEPEHLEAEARGTEAAVLRAFSAPPALPVLSRTVAGSYNALSEEEGSGAAGAWSPFAPRPALSSGGAAGAALVEGLASWTARAGRLGAGAPVQRQVEAQSLSGAGVSMPAGSSASAAMSPHATAPVAGEGHTVPPATHNGELTPHLTTPASGEGVAGLASSSGQAVPRAVQRRGRRHAAGESPTADPGNTPTAPASSTESGVWNAGAENANIGNTPTAPTSALGGAATLPAAPLQRLAAAGTLLGDLARRHDAHVSPGAVPLSSIFSAGSKGTRMSVQRRGARDIGGSLTFGTGVPGLAALAGGAAVRAAASLQSSPSSQSSAATNATVSPSIQRTASTAGTGMTSLPSASTSLVSGSAGSSFPAIPPDSTGIEGGHSDGSNAGGAWSTLPARAGSVGRSAALSTDDATIPILQRLTAGSLRAPVPAPSSDALSMPVLARMSASEYGALLGASADGSGTSRSGADSPLRGGQDAGWTGLGAFSQAGHDAGWTGLGSLSLGGQGAGWAGAAGGILHHVQRTAIRQSGTAISGGATLLPLGGSSSISQGSIGGPGSAPFESPLAVGMAAESAVAPSTAAVQRADASRPGWSTRESVPAPGMAAVQRTRAYPAGAPMGMMSLSGQGHGLAAMSGGLASRALGAAALQRASAAVLTSRGTAYSPSSGSGFSLPSTAGIGPGRSAPGSSPTLQRFGAGESARHLPMVTNLGTPVLQRFAAGESGGAALGAAMLGRMSGTGASGWAPVSSGALAGASGALAGAAGGIAWHVQRMVGSASLGAGLAVGSAPLGGAMTIGPAVDSGSSSSTAPAARGSSASQDFTSTFGSPVFTALPAMQRMDSAAWMGGASGTLAGQTYGWAAMSGGLTARALQAAGAGLASPIQRTGVEQRGTGSGGPATGWSMALPLQGQSDGTSIFTQRFATSAAIGQAAAGAAQRLATTPVLLGGGRPHSGELAGSPPAIMVSRMWSGRPMGGAMTDDAAPGAATPTGSPVPGLTEMTQRSQGTSAMLVFSGLTGDETASSSASGAGLAALPVNRAVAMPPSTPA